MIDRRAFLNYAAVLPLAGAASRIVRAGDLAAAEKADYTLRIGTGLVELAPDHMKTKTPKYTVHEGRRYQVKLRTTPAITSIRCICTGIASSRCASGGKPTPGIIKDVVMLGGFQKLEFDFVADNPGLTLSHCHQQLHMDFGFMALFQYAQVNRANAFGSGLQMTRNSLP